MLWSWSWQVPRNGFETLRLRSLQFLSNGFFSKRAVLWCSPPLSLYSTQQENMRWKVSAGKKMWQVSWFLPLFDVKKFYRNISLLFHANRLQKNAPDRPHNQFFFLLLLTCDTADRMELEKIKTVYISSYHSQTCCLCPISLSCYQDIGIPIYDITPQLKKTFCAGKKTLKRANGWELLSWLISFIF